MADGDTNTLVMAWGKCTITGLGTDSNGVVPVEGTTQLNVTEGEKSEATEEGGGVVAVRYAKNKYELQFATRQKITGVTDDDGVVTAPVTNIILKPEASGAPQMTIAKAYVTCVPSFSSTDGWQYTYKCSAVRVNNSASITWSTT